MAKINLASCVLNTVRVDVVDVKQAGIGAGTLATRMRPTALSCRRVCSPWSETDPEPLARLNPQPLVGYADDPAKRAGRSASRMSGSSVWLHPSLLAVSVPFTAHTTTGGMSAETTTPRGSTSSETVCGSLPHMGRFGWRHPAGCHAASVWGRSTAGFRGN